MAIATLLRAAEAPSPPSRVPLLQRIIELQQKAESGPLTEAEQAELYRIETEWRNGCLTDPNDIPSRAEPVDAAPLFRRPPAAHEGPAATVKAYRRTGGAIVSVERQGRPAHRYVVSLRRYHALREWTLTRAARRWKTSGAWLRASMTCSIWERRP